MKRTLIRLSTVVLLPVTLLVLGGWAISASAQAPVCDPALLEPGCLYFPSDRYDGLADDYGDHHLYRHRRLDSAAFPLRSASRFRRPSPCRS